MLDFELEIGLGKGREYQVAVVHSPAGEARSIGPILGFAGAGLSVVPEAVVQY